MSTITTSRRIAASVAATAVLATGAASSAHAAPGQGEAHREAPAQVRKAPARPAPHVAKKATPTKKAIATKKVRARSAVRVGSTTTTVRQSTTAVSTPSAVTYASTTSVSTSGLSANAVKVVKTVNANFPQVTSIGGLRSGASAQDHATGHAVDLMTSDKATGDQIAAYMQQHASELGIKYVIWRQHIWSVQRADEGWRAMADRGSATANHYDHVHVSVN